MLDPFLALTPVCVAGVLALVRFTGCDKLLGLVDIQAPPMAMLDFEVDPANPPTSRTDYSGWVGMLIQPQTDVQITHLGRWRAAMGTQPHQVKLVDGATGDDVTGGIVTVSLSTGGDGSFVYAAVSGRVTLAAGAYYFLLSQETAGTDVFYDFGLTVAPTADFIVPAAAFSDSGGKPFIQKGGLNDCYGPVSALYYPL